VASLPDPGRLEKALLACGLRGPFFNLRPLSGGAINQAYALETGDGPVFVKANQAAPPDFFLRERESLEALAQAGSSLRIPKVIGGFLSDHPSKADLQLLVMEYLDPVSPSPRLWEAFGRGLAELHGGMEPRYGFRSDNYLGSTPQPNGWMEDWGKFFAERRIGHLIDQLRRAGKLSAQESNLYDRLLEKIPALLSHRPPASFLHGDLWSGNFLATAQGPALIDPAVYYGDREAEWAMMRLFGGFPEIVFDAYQEVFPLPPGWRERLPLYQLYQLLNHKLLFGGGYGEQAWAAAGKYF
jgi:protein-ribulosamine 3-kinase